MNTRFAGLGSAFVLLITGCAVPGPRETPQTETARPSWRLQPKLGPRTALHIYVEDSRPSVELAKPPSKEFLYSGSLFSVDGNAETIATDLGGMAVKFGGAETFDVVGPVPQHGPAIAFTLEHWYSKMPLKPEKGPLFIRGEFGGVVTLLLDGQPVASERIDKEGTPTVIDMYVIFDSEKLQTPRLVRKGMETTANSSQQEGYAEIAAFLQSNWHLLQPSN